jgi:predicted MFS family arabinose efflux permease
VGTLLLSSPVRLDLTADDLGGGMGEVAWLARAAWLVGLVAVLALTWRRRRWRRAGTDAPPGSRVARHQHLYEAANVWPWMALTGLLLIAQGASIASRDPTGQERALGKTGIVLGAIGLAVGVAGLLIEWHWNRGQSEGKDRHSSP